jgi:hypothetical protein
MTDFVKNFPEIIKEAAQNPLGIAALIILVVSVIAISFFSKASEKTRIIVFICIIIGFLGFGLAIYLKSRDMRIASIPKPTSPPSAPYAVSPPPPPPGPTEIPPPDIKSGIANFEKCLGNVPKDTIGYLEEGSHDKDLIEIDKLNNRTLNIIFTDNRKPIRAMKVNYYYKTNMFKIESTVNAICQLIR